MLDNFVAKECDNRFIITIEYKGWLHYDVVVIPEECKLRYDLLDAIDSQLRFKGEFEETQRTLIISRSLITPATTIIQFDQSCQTASSFVLPS